MSAWLDQVFISYRRDDVPGVAGRIADRLSQKWKYHVFFDVESIRLGADFVSSIEDRIERAAFFLAVIGRNWRGAAPDGGSRFDDPNDLVRFEVSRALIKSRIVVPVLVDDAQMPLAEELPEDLRPLTRRNAAFLRHNKFHADLDHLIKNLKRPRFG